MNEGNAKSGFYVSRREFLKYSFSAGVVIWAGSQVPRGMSEAEAATLFTVNRVNPAVFPQSVASGDPQPNGIILWTRIAALNAGTTVAFQIARDTTFRTPVLQGTAQTSADKDNVVKMQLRDAKLSPFTTYYYRFIYNGNASRTGRFKTLPAATANVPRVRFGYVSCQDYTNGFYTALAFLAEEDVDFIVHLGDYIYETVDESSFQGGQVRSITFPSDATNSDTEGVEPGEKAQGFDNDGESDTLTDYRFLYKTYKADRNLQRLHERFAFITIWDDHEFANDCYQEFAPDAAGTAPAEDASRGVNSNPDALRRSAANQAWVEYTPVGMNAVTASPDSGVRYQPAVEDPTQEIGIYRTFVFGNLLELVMLDERLYRDGPPNGLDTQDRLLTPGTQVDGQGEEAPGRTMLGNGTLGADGRPRPNQLKYFTDKMQNSTRRWKIMGNETMFMQFKLANTFVDTLSAGGPFPNPPVPVLAGAEEGVYLNLDQWDGYQAERRAIAQAVKDVRNFVIITGDLHTFIAGYVRENYDDVVPPFVPGTPPPDAVGVCFMGGSVTSSNLTEIATLGQGSRVPGPGFVPGGSEAFTAQAQASNPHFKFLDSTTHGYNVIEVTPTKLTCIMRAVSTISSPQATLRTLRTFTVPDGQIVING